MHILFVAGWWPTKESPVNGTFIQEHAVAISQYAKVTVVYLNSVEKSQSWSDFPSTVKKHHTKVDENLDVLILDLKLRIRRFGVFEAQLIKMIQQLLDQYKDTAPIDIIHLNILNTHLTSNILKYSEKLKVPIVLLENSTFYHTEIYQLPSEDIQVKKREITELVNKPRLKYILPVSSELGNVLTKDYHVAKERLVIVPNVANAIFLSGPVIKPAAKKEAIIFAAAVWSHSKNPMLFFNVLALLKTRDKQTYQNLKIKWGGDGSKMQEVKAFIAKELPDLNIDFLGMLTKKEIYQHMCASDFLVHPTDAENLPCIIIESICAGLPVISSKANGIVELIDESNGRMYATNDVEDFYLNFLKMLDNIQHFDREAIALKARKRYSAAAIGKQITEVYERILS